MAPDRRFVVRASRELWVQVERLVRSQRVLSGLPRQLLHGGVQLQR